jgi:hypothetical protein
VCAQTKRVHTSSCEENSKRESCFACAQHKAGYSRKRTQASDRGTHVRKGYEEGRLQTLCSHATTAHIGDQATRETQVVRHDRGKRAESSCRRKAKYSMRRGCAGARQRVQATTRNVSQRFSVCGVYHGWWWWWRWRWWCVCGGGRGAGGGGGGGRRRPPPPPRGYLL